METQRTNIFIVDDNKLMVLSLKHYLEKKFGAGVNVSIFYEGESCLEKINKQTDIVILDYFLDGENKNAKNGLEILKSIKEINPQTEVILFSSNEGIAIAIEAFRAGATDYVVKGDKAWDKITSLVNKIITEPLRMMVREYGVAKFLTVFLFVFLSMGAAVYCTMKLLR
jgi:two-component system OmpR family response regulator